MLKCIFNGILQTVSAYLNVPLSILIFNTSTENILWFYIITNALKISVSVFNIYNVNFGILIFSPVTVNGSVIWWFFMYVWIKAFLPLFCKTDFFSCKIQNTLSRFKTSENVNINLCYIAFLRFAIGEFFFFSWNFMWNTFKLIYIRFGYLYNNPKWI